MKAWAARRSLPPLPVAAGGEYGVGVGDGDPSPVFDDPVFDDPGRFEPGRFNVGRSSGVGVEDGGGVGEGDCAMEVVMRKSNKMNDNEVRMNFNPSVKKCS